MLSPGKTKVRLTRVREGILFFTGMYIPAKWKRLGIALTALAMSIGSVANGDELLSMTLEELLEVPVQSTSFFNETLSSSTYSVNVVAKDEFDGLAVRNVAEILNTLPSTIAPFNFGQSRALAVRGYLAEGSTTGTGVLLDGVPMNKLRQGSAQMEMDGYDLAILDSVELIRGPGSVLHGNDAFHGVFSLNTWSPRIATQAVSFEGGQGEFRAASASIHHPFGDQSVTAVVAYRLLGDADQRYAYFNPVLEREEESSRSLRRESSNALLKYAWKATDALTIRVTGFALEFDGEGLPGIGEALGIENQQDRDFSNYASETYFLKMEAEYRTQDWGVFDFSAYYWLNDDHFEADFGTVAAIGNIQLDEWRGESNFGFQVFHRLEPSDLHQIAYGFEYGEAELNEFRFTTMGADGTVLAEGDTRPEVGTIRKTHSAVFDGRSELRGLDVDLVYGLRFDEFNDLEFQVSPRLGAVTRIGRLGVLKFMAARAFRAPTLLEIYGSPAISPNFDLQPEHLNNLQLAFLWEWGNSTHTVTVFRNWWNDAIRATAQNVNGQVVDTMYENAGERESVGVEWESTFLWNDFQLDLIGSFVESRNLDEQRRFEAFPSWIVNVNLQYAPSTRWSIHWTNRYMGLDRYHGGSGFLVELESPEAEPYFRSDLVVSWQPSENLRIHWMARNVFDRQNVLPSASGQIRGLQDLRRNLSIKIELSF